MRFALNDSLSSRIAVIGTGAVGSAVARRLLRAGCCTVVWNRTASRASELVAAGATLAPSLHDAVASCTLVLLALADHRAVDDCLAQVDRLLPGQTLVGLYTATPREAQLTAQRVSELGAQYIQAGVQASPEFIGTADALILFSGPHIAFDRHKPILDLLCTPRFAGESAQAAATWDLALFGVWYDAQLGVLRALDAAREAGLDLFEFSRTSRAQLEHVVSGVPATTAELHRRDFPPGPSDLAGHLPVIRHLVELRSGRPLGDGGLSAVATRIEQLIAEGHASQGLTATIA